VEVYGANIHTTACHSVAFAPKKEPVAKTLQRALAEATKAFRLSFVNFMSCENMLPFIKHLHEIHAFGKIAYVVVLPLEVFKRLYFFAHQIEDEDL
jgi:hypothetical protein